MRRSRFTEDQINVMIKEQEAGMPTAEVCRSTWPQSCVVLQVQSQIWRDECF
jgi:hypothetical protein